MPILSNFKKLNVKVCLWNIHYICPMDAKKTILMILDGWGIGIKPSSDAIATAETPVMDDLMKSYPNSTLLTFGEDVGLPLGQMGNSEVGHMNIGAGRVIFQDLARINKDIREGKVADQAEIIALSEYCKSNHKPLHILVLVSDGGVHSHIDHLEAFVHILTGSGIKEGYIHAFTDGRDTSPTSGIDFIKKVIDFSGETSFKLASLIGRYYAMDRDHRWERVKKAYDLLVRGIGNRTSNPLDFIQNNYDRDITDEFLEPWMSGNLREGGLPTINEDDAVLFLNFRTDRPRQLTEVLTQHAIPDFDMVPLRLYFTAMAKYDEAFQNIHVIYTKDNLGWTLGEAISHAHKTQLRVAETEKYPHVTFFFSGGREDPFEGERRALVPSPKVATYDLQPEMSAQGVKNAVLFALEDDRPDFICVNFANTDMVGHTGDFDAAMKAAVTVDQCVGEIIEKAIALDYRLLILADHGNSDYMINEDGSPNTAHTMNLVPCILVAGDAGDFSLKNGRLADIAPSILYSMGIHQPIIMKGENLIQST